MALPVTVTSQAGQRGHAPPFMSSAGNVYVITRGTDAAQLDAFKATDPTDSFVAVDTTGHPSGGTVALAVTQRGKMLHAVAWTGAGIEYHAFDTSADTWSTVDDTVDSVTNDPDQGWVSIAARTSTAALVIAYNGDTDAVMGGDKERTDYAVGVAGIWNSGNALTDSGTSTDVHYGNPNVVKSDTSDDMHFLWQFQSNTADPPTSWLSTIAQTLDPGNSLSTIDTDAEETGSNLLGIQNGVSYDDGGTTRIAFVGAENTGAQFTLWATEDASADISIGGTALVGNDVFDNGELGIISVAELNADLHVIFSGGSGSRADQDVLYMKSTDDGVTWGSSAEEIDAITANFISTNIYVRGADTVMAYFYDDGGVQKYNEKVLIAGSAAPAAIPIRGFKLGGILGSTGIFTGGQLPFVPIFDRKITTEA